MTFNEFISELMRCLRAAVLPLDGARLSFSMVSAFLNNLLLIKHLIYIYIIIKYNYSIFIIVIFTPFVQIQQYIKKRPLIFFLILAIWDQIRATGLCVSVHFDLISQMIGLQSCFCTSYTAQKCFSSLYIRL